MQNVQNMCDIVYSMVVSPGWFLFSKARVWLNGGSPATRILADFDIPHDIFWCCRGGTLDLPSALFWLTVFHHQTKPTHSAKLAQSFNQYIVLKKRPLFCNWQGKPLSEICLVLVSKFAHKLTPGMPTRVCFR